MKDRYVVKNLELIQEMLELNDNQDTLALKLKREQSALISSKYLATINFAINHNNLEVAPYLMLSEAFNSNIKYLDTVYNTLTPKIKDSKYGKELKSFIINRKKDTVL